MTMAVIGWDFGGAHLKAVKLDAGGMVERAVQLACPLWQGLDQLESALDQALAELQGHAAVRHAVTMTGELADNFTDRAEGVRTLTDVAQRRLGGGQVLMFAGFDGLIPAKMLTPAAASQVASANWLASGLWVGLRLPEALLVDIGSTTTDILPVRDRRPLPRGFTDSERMRHDELLYTGVARTPAMMLAERAPLAGNWAPVMAELFATAADVYRLTGELPERADQFPAADQGAKTVTGSCRRLARQFGHDADALAETDWRRAARYLCDRQLARIAEAVDLQLSRKVLGEDAPLVGAGVGRFLVRNLAQRLGRNYVDFSTLFEISGQANGFDVADCGPAAAVASLAYRQAEGAF
jgi:probable H4MPT-linked C1 transfer pathway protein